MRSVRQFAASCNFEQSHAEHVAHLALQIFDQLASDAGARMDNGSEPAWASTESRELLHAAALLHDVGYFINYASHHKHTYHLIMHSDLAWFTHRQRELIANIARYHRGARPKKRHANFAALDREDREIMVKLASILRVAVGLDRSHTHTVQSLTLRLHEGLALMQLYAERDASVDVWGAVRKRRMFERAFGLRLRIICPPVPAADAANHHAPAQPVELVEQQNSKNGSQSIL
jgi:exopolyphosphatase/guanosine-5'-triphosphate,3'-diphosphate pyrophosphatase